MEAGVVQRASGHRQRRAQRQQHGPLDESEHARRSTGEREKNKEKRESIEKRFHVNTLFIIAPQPATTLVQQEECTRRSRSRDAQAPPHSKLFEKQKKSRCKGMSSSSKHSRFECEIMKYNAHTTICTHRHAMFALTTREDAIKEVNNKPAH